MMLWAVIFGVLLIALLGITYVINDPTPRVTRHDHLRRLQEQKRRQQMEDSTD